MVFIKPMSASYHILPCLAGKIVIEFTKYLLLCCRYGCGGGLLLSDCCGDLLKERPSETVFLFSDGLLAQTLRTPCVRSTYILLVELRFHMGYGLLMIHGYSPFLVCHKLRLSQTRFNSVISFS